MLRVKTKQTAGAASAAAELTDTLFLRCLPDCVSLSQPALQQPQSACRAGSESNLYPLFVLVSFQVECASLLEALVQLLPLCPSGELFSCCQIGKFVFCLRTSFTVCGRMWTAWKMCVPVLMPDSVATVNLLCFVVTDYHRELILLKVPHTLWSFITHISRSGCWEVTCRVDGTEWDWECQKFLPGFNHSPISVSRCAWRTVSRHSH